MSCSFCQLWGLPTKHYVSYEDRHLDEHLVMIVTAIENRLTQEERVVEQFSESVERWKVQDVSQKDSNTVFIDQVVKMLIVNKGHCVLKGKDLQKIENLEQND